MPRRAGGCPRSIHVPIHLAPVQQSVQTDQPSQMESRSDQACKACKKHKRRCDKGLPDCGLCRRTGRACQYGLAPEPQPTADDLALLQERLADLESRLTGSPGLTRTSASVSTSHTYDMIDPNSPLPSSAASNSRITGYTPSSSGIEGPSTPSGGRFPAAMFLDIDCFVWSRARIPSPRGAIPTAVLALLSQGNVVLEVSREYFSTIHTWLPMVSKKRMDMGLPVQNAGPDLAMLFLGMKLVTAQPCDVADGLLYSTAKDFLGLLERNGTVSLVTLQAMILVAVYEYGHGIYPAAWMTIGACARYADILDLLQGDHALLGQPTTWTEAEERRRVWWSIFVLDRVVSTGSRRRCTIPSPQPDTRLPSDDEAWDAGDVSKSVGYSISTPYQVEQSSFARLCQASIFLGRALDHERNCQEMSTSQVAAIMSLADELTGFGATVDNESRPLNPENQFALLAPRCIVRSALFVALDRFTCPERIGAEAGYAERPGAKSQSEIDLQQRSMRVIELASQQLHGIGMDVMARFCVDADSIQHYALGHASPLILDAMYASAATFHWIVSEGGKDVHRTAASDLEQFLETMGARWGLAGAYREILTIHDVSVREGARVT